MKEIPVWAPGAGFKRNAFRVRGLVRALMDMPYNMVKTALVRPRLCVRLCGHSS